MGAWLRVMQIFSLVDTDGSGEISTLEVKHLMSLLGEDVDLHEVDNLITEFDLDGSGEVDLAEFILVLALQRKSDFKKQDILRNALTGCLHLYTDSTIDRLGGAGLVVLVWCRKHCMLVQYTRV